MATPPRNDQRDRQTGATAKNGKRWPIYIAIVVIVLLIIFVFFGDLFTTDEQTQEEGAVIESTSPPADGTGDVAVTGGTDPETEGATAATDEPVAETDPSASEDPEADSEESEENVIELDGDADVEILDDT